MMRNLKKWIVFSIFVSCLFFCCGKDRSTKNGVLLDTEVSNKKKSSQFLRLVWKSEPILRMHGISVNSSRTMVALNSKYFVYLYKIKKGHLSLIQKLSNVGIDGYQMYDGVVTFSEDNRYIAAADQDQHINVWKRVKDRYQFYQKIYHSKPWPGNTMPDSVTFVTFLPGAKYTLCSYLKPTFSGQPTPPELLFVWRNRGNKFVRSRKIVFKEKYGRGRVASIDSRRRFLQLVGERYLYTYKYDSSSFYLFKRSAVSPSMLRSLTIGKTKLYYTVGQREGRTEINRIASGSESDPEVKKKYVTISGVGRNKKKVFVLSYDWSAKGADFSGASRLKIYSLDKKIATFLGKYQFEKMDIKQVVLFQNYLLLNVEIERKADPNRMCQLFQFKIAD